MKWPVLIGCLIGCREPAQRPLPTAPDRVSLDAGVTDSAPLAFIGVLTAAESVDIAPRVAGILAKVHVGIGDVVTVDQVVAEMDPAQMREEVRAAEAAFAASRAALDQALVDVEDAKRKLALEIKSVEAGVSPTQNLEESRLGVKRAEAAAQRMRSTQAVEAARTQTVRDHVTDARLRSPFAGTVALRFHDAGNRIEAGAPIVRIVGHGSMRLRFAVPPEHAKLAVVGRVVTATVETVLTPVTATIKQVAPALDPTSGMILVEAELAAATGDLRSGLAAWVKP